MARISKYATANAASAQKESFWRAGLYIRLSREDGDKPESESVASQKALLEGFLAQREDLRLYDYYIDDGWSGTDFDRPSFQRMLADVTGKKINCVVVKDLSRFGRNYVEAGKYLETVFPLFGVRFIALNDQIDNVANPQSMNTVIVPFKNIMNDEYCRDISMKVRSALDIRRKQGKFIGAFAGYGYQKAENDHNQLVVDELSAQIVREIFRKFLSGYSVLGIARELNERGIPNPSAYRRKSNGARSQSGLWCDSTVRRILTNELYIGNLIQKKYEVVSYKVHAAKSVAENERISVKNTHEPIITREEFEKVRALLKRDTRTAPKSNELSLFSGFVKCADCGRAMQKRTVKQPYKTYDYYVCSTYKKMHRGACGKHAIRIDTLEQTVLTVLNKYIALAVDFGRLSEKIKAAFQRGKRERLGSDLERAEREKVKTQSLLLDLYPDYKEGILNREQYFGLKEKYETLLSRLETEIVRIGNEVAECAKNAEESFGFVNSFRKYDGMRELSRDVVTELIENIYIHEDGEVEIRLKCKDTFLAAEEFLRRNALPVQETTGKAAEYS
jgi:DNA invertase Pin-like site-specific DNA recombinase